MLTRSVRGFIAQFPLGRKLRRAQLDHARPTAVRILEIDLDPGHVILPRGREIAPAGCARATEGAARTEELGEEVAELGRAFVAWTAARLPAAPAGELEALAPIGRRPEILSGTPVLAELVVCRALLGILEDLVRFLQLLELCLGVGLLADVWMVLARKPAIRTLDDLLRGIARHAHHLVVVPEFHGVPAVSAQIPNHCARQARIKKPAAAAVSYAQGPEPGEP